MFSCLLCLVKALNNVYILINCGEISHFVLLFFMRVKINERSMRMIITDGERAVTGGRRDNCLSSTLIS